MRHQIGAAFRRALEDRLRTQSRATGEPLVRLRKMVAFERLLARLLAAQPDAWVLKGGLALQLRLGPRARTTKDMDILLAAPPADLHTLLVVAANMEMDDWFEFQVERPARRSAAEFGGARFHVQCLLDGRRFERFHVDVGVGDPLLEPAEALAMPHLLAFASLQPTVAPCYPLPQQIAEKLHAYTRPHMSGENTRVKDLVDILLMARMAEFEHSALRRAVEATFTTRGTHPLPARLPDPPRSWGPTLRRLAAEVRLEWHNLADAGNVLRAFVDPVLRDEATGTWKPASWAWET